MQVSQQRLILLAFTVLLVCGSLAVAQSISSSSGTVRGTVLDPSGAAIPNATVRIQNPVSHYDVSVKTDANGNFEFNNIPYNPYHLSAQATGFQGAEQDLDIRSQQPVIVKISVKIGTANESVTVTAAGDLLENDATGHTDVDRALFDKLPLESTTSALSSLVTLATPGATADSNGLVHGLGDHAQNSMSIDGQPMTDQFSKVFSNQLPVDAVQSLEVIEGAPPAEYGGKTSLVIVATTRSGLGSKQPHGEITGSYGTFGTGTGGFNLGYGGDRWGNFISLSGLNTGRFLDPSEYQVFHDHGNEQNVFDRLDFKLSNADSINVNLGFTRSWFQTPNSYDSQNATAWYGLTVDNNGLGPDGKTVGSQDQRSQIRTFNIAPVWTRLVGNSSVFTLGAYIRQDQFNYYGSRNPFADLTPGLQLDTESQNRSLKNAGVRMSYSIVNKIHNIKIGATYQHTYLSERDNFGLVDPTANAPCLNADGSAYTSPSLADPNGCGGTLQQNPNFVPLLGCYDLTRTAPLPASDGCATSKSGAYQFYGFNRVRELAFYIQDSITVRNWNFNLGVRVDRWMNSGLASSMAEPRLGIAYNIKPSNTVLRISYARSMETPFNENLVLASYGCNDAAINALQSTVAPCQNNSPLTPGHRNEFHAGLQQAFGRYLVIDGEYIWKYTHRAYDFSVLGNTPITYPIEWQSSKIPGYAVRATVPNYHGLTAFVVFSSVAARFFGPQIAGIGSGPGDSAVFRIDHDELFNATTHLQYQPWKTGPWFSFNWRYDSGLVAGPAPCAGGNCGNGPDGTDTIVNVSGLTPDQQFQAGLSCGGVLATPTAGISPTGLCPASKYASKYLSIPAAGTENDDHNPPRIAPRSLFDLGIGHDNLFHSHSDKYKWSARLTVVNLTNKEALYNFISTFSGTHYVTPRTVSATVGFHF